MDILITKLNAMKHIFSKKFHTLPTDYLIVREKQSGKFFRIYFNELLFLNVGNLKQYFEKYVYAYLQYDYPKRKYLLPLTSFRFSQKQIERVRQFNLQHNVSKLTFEIRGLMQEKNPSLEKLLERYT